MSLGPITLGHYLSLGGLLFALSVIGIYPNRRNLIVLLMAIELMLLAVNMNFVAFSHYLGDMSGRGIRVLHPTVAAAEARPLDRRFAAVLFRNKNRRSTSKNSMPWNGLTGWRREWSLNLLLAVHLALAGWLPCWQVAFGRLVATGSAAASRAHR